MKKSLLDYLAWKDVGAQNVIIGWHNKNSWRVLEN